jgi:6,7-dimethyl-8-ribityllumazine synthase
VKEFRGKLDSKDLNVAIVISRFNATITERLLQGAMDVLERTGLARDKVSVARVPGSFEIPLTAQRLAQTERFDAIICLGALIRGETPHFDYICQQVSSGISEIALKFNLPVTYGVITADTVEQAMNRAGLKHGNKGTEAAMAAVEMAGLMKEIAD